VAGIVVQLSFLSRPVCLPVLARLWQARHTGKIAQAREELAELIAARYPDRTTAPSEGHRPSGKHGHEPELHLSDTPGQDKQSHNPVTGDTAVTSDL
jgi:hypothetical protein